MITGIIVDQREPDWVMNAFPGYPIASAMLDYGDLWIACDDNNMLQIERKTPDDLLGSIRDQRIFDQVRRLTEPRLTQLLKNEQPTNWPYLVVTGQLLLGANGTVYTGRETGWQWNSVWGALTTIQEMGCFIHFAPSDTEYSKTIIMLANRSRAETIDILPARMPVQLDAKSNLLCTLPGIGIETAKKIMDWSGSNLSWALCGLTDMNIEAPVGKSVRSRIRGFFNLPEQQSFEIILDDDKKEKLVIQ
jgi:ERCC4-type nuclease